MGWLIELVDWECSWGGLDWQGCVWIGEDEAHWDDDWDGDLDCEWEAELEG